MSRIHCLIGLIVMLMLVVLPANAETTARVLGMGNTMLGVGNDSAAWFNNPALLPDLDADSLVSPWPNSMSIGAEVGGDFHDLAINFSSRDAAGQRGWGVGFESFGGDMQSFGVGYGQRCNFVDGLNWGIIGVSFDDGASDDFLFALDLALDVPLPLNDLTVALELWDVTEQFGDMDLNLGAGLKTSAGLTVGVDVFDITDDGAVNFGAEYAGPLTNGFIVRAGSNDGDATFGLGFDMGFVELGLSYMDAGGNDDFLFATAETSL